MEIDIVNELNKLNLIDNPVDEIRSILNKIGRMALMITDYQQPKIIESAVSNTDAELEFNTVERISFKPAKFNTSYQRASTPSNTMFYGAVIPEELSAKEIEYARIIGASEVAELIRNKDLLEGESRIIAFGGHNT